MKNSPVAFDWRNAVFLHAGVCESSVPKTNIIPAVWFWSGPVTQRPGMWDLTAQSLSLTHAQLYKFEQDEGRTSSKLREWERESERGWMTVRPSRQSNFSLFSTLTCKGSSKSLSKSLSIHTNIILLLFGNYSLLVMHEVWLMEKVKYLYWSPAQEKNTDQALERSFSQMRRKIWLSIIIIIMLTIELFYSFFNYHSVHYSTVDNII